MPKEVISMTTANVTDSLIIAQVLCEREQLDRERGEAGFTLLRQRPPTIGDCLSIGSDRPWQVVHVDEYVCGDERVYFAMIALADETIPHPSQWITSIERQHFPATDFVLCLDPDGTLIQCGGELPGQHPTGRLERYFPDPRPAWIVDRVEIFQPIQSTFYGAIYLCWCAPEI